MMRSDLPSNIRLALRTTGSAASAVALVLNVNRRHAKKRMATTVTPRFGCVDTSFGRSQFFRVRRERNCCDSVGFIGPPITVSCGERESAERGSHAERWLAVLHLRHERRGVWSTPLHRCPNWLRRRWRPSVWYWLGSRYRPRY